MFRLEKKYTYHDNNQAEERLGKLELRNGKEIEIIEGLNEGEKVTKSSIISGKYSSHWQ